MPTYYNSCFEHGVDGKRRVQVPAKWRPATPGTEFTLIVWPKAKEGTCLRVLPPKRMAELIQTIEAIPNTNPNKTVLQRFIGRDSCQVTLDKAGRICLPEPMARDAGITTQALFVGLLTCFEIWNPERHRAVKVSDQILSSEALQMVS